MTFAPKVLVVDDSAAIRLAVAKALALDPAIGAVIEARDGRAALAKIRDARPDVVILDVEMPELDGLETLREIRSTNPLLPVIMFSSKTQRGALTTLDALALGASDYVTKPSLVGASEAMALVRTELVPRILALASARRGARAIEPSPAVASVARRRWAGPAQVVVIASSTGGPAALAAILPRLAGVVRVPILIVQHMPPVFTGMLASRLRADSGLAVAEAQDGASLALGGVWIAPGGYHMTVGRTSGAPVLQVHRAPPVGSLRPSADLMFGSAADVYRAGVLAVVLSGMGTDGLEGCARVRAAGGYVIAQDEKSSVVWGMPGAVCRDGLADVVAPLTSIADEIAARSSAPSRLRAAAPLAGSR